MNLVELHLLLLSGADRSINAHLLPLARIADLAFVPDSYISHGRGYYLFKDILICMNLHMSKLL